MKIIVIGTSLKLNGVDTFDWDENFKKELPNIAEYDLIILNFTDNSDKINQLIKVGSLASHVLDRIKEAFQKQTPTVLISLGAETNFTAINPLNSDIITNNAIVNSKNVKNSSSQFNILESNFSPFILEYYKFVNVQYEVQKNPNASKLLIEPIFQNSTKKALGLKRKYFTGEIFLLPKISDPSKTNEAIKSLLKMFGNWSENFEYLDNPKYQISEVIQVKKEKDDLIKSHEDKLKELDEKLARIKEENKYAQELLSGSDDVLHKSCKKVLDEIFRLLGSKAKVIDVDEEDEFKEKDGRKKHDIQIDINFNSVKYFLINVKSAEKKFRQQFLSQINIHEKQFMKNKGCSIDEVQSIAILNHQPEVSPEERGNVFGDNQKEVIENITTEERTVLESGTLYYIYKKLKENNNAFTEEDLLVFFRKAGFLTTEDFEDILKKQTGTSIKI